MIKIIAAIGRNNELGKNGKLIWNLPGDLKFFKEQTLNYPIVMGRLTFNSLPRVLPKRLHFVLTKSLRFNKNADGVMVYFDFEDLLKEVLRISLTQDVYIIGGESIYRRFVEYADEIILTEIDAEDNEADAHFPPFDKTQYTKCHIASNEDNGIKYNHIRYVKK